MHEHPHDGAGGGPDAVDGDGAPALDAGWGGRDHLPAGMGGAGRHQSQEVLYWEGDINAYAGMDLFEQERAIAAEPPPPGAH